MPFTDVVIIGSGIAALSAAKQLCKHKNVMIITKSRLEDSNSMLAQGGVAAVIDQHDDWQDHYHDTIVAGCFHNKDSAVKQLVKDGTIRIQNLIEEGMIFDQKEDGTIDLGKEGAHNRNRILHAGGDATGKLLVEFMLHQLKEKVTFVEQEMAIDLILENGQCSGITTIDLHGIVKNYIARHVILATGGCGGLYEVTSNAEGMTGDGLSIAFRAGAELSDLEFIQFHPTLLYTANGNKGLISEAVRGEGATLINDQGYRFMEGVHQQFELAPRDVVARAIQYERSQGRNVYLDISMIPHFDKRFPTITSICEEAGIDLSKGLIPVAPGAHFMMGGIKTNTKGETSIPGLYAVGEVACTGVHGANRLASNSLLEGIVFGHNLAQVILEQHNQTISSHLNTVRDIKPFKADLPEKNEIQKMMTTYVGIERDLNGLTFVKNWVEQYLSPHWLKGPLIKGTKEEVAVINMLTTSWLIITSAIVRTESRGGHFRSDYPMSLDKWQNNEIIRHNNQVMFTVDQSLVRSEINESNQINSNAATVFY
ncbi:L-aspartate oxidase [Bacillus sp. PS06]|uniref:L-aspartate oxidase n=1 Tax=Bacillus sp. PS06 TaxID=2764176 RepID=UPI0017844A75|nr:L-aspartate oxidase [Bacillus sp. PS06]